MIGKMVGVRCLKSVDTPYTRLHLRWGSLAIAVLELIAVDHYPMLANIGGRT